MVADVAQPLADVLRHLLQHVPGVAARVEFVLLEEIDGRLGQVRVPFAMQQQVAFGQGDDQFLLLRVALHFGLRLKEDRQKPVQVVGALQVFQADEPDDSRAAFDVAGVGDDVVDRGERLTASVKHHELRPADTRHGVHA